LGENLGFLAIGILNSDEYIFSSTFMHPGIYCKCQYVVQLTLWLATTRR